MSAPQSRRPSALDAALAARPDSEALAAVWEALPAAPDTMVTATDREAAWAALSARAFDASRAPYADDVAAPLALHVDTEDAAAPLRPRWSSQRLVMLSALAASVLAMVWSAVPRTFERAPGAAATSVTLADGSTVWLDGGSRLSVSRRLGWPVALRPATRAVRVEGQAFFAVAHDGRPFEVRTTDATVRVLGTRFEVRTRPSGSQVAVEEGHVAVTALATRERVELRAGDATRVTRAGLTSTRVSASRVATWRAGGFSALDEPLRDVLAELSRRYATPITLENDVTADAPVSVFYPLAPSLDTMLADLCTTHGLRFRHGSRGVVISNAPR